MDYYIITNKDCNLRCLYCYRKKQLQKNTKPSKQLLRDTAHFILSYPSSIKKVVFHGGEPLLTQDIIKELICLMKGHNVTYNLYTNGTLLETIDFEILKINYITISIDGVEKIHNKFRGENTFRTIINNLIKIRPKFKGHIMARITLALDPETSLWDSISGLLDSGLFDSITWQIENTSKFYNSEDLNRFIKRYEKDISRLFDYWMAHISSGKILNILPIQAIINSLLLNENHKNFRCGCGSDLIFIDLTDKGQCYACDELIDVNQFKIGNIYSGINFPDILRHTTLNKDCSFCEIKYICGGRCLRSCSIFPKERFLFLL